MEEYKGLHITCEYLGVLDASSCDAPVLDAVSSCQDAGALESGKYLKDPLSWPELGPMEL